MRPNHGRIINYLRHPLASRQALAALLDYWREDRDTPVVLVVPAGEGVEVAKQIRVCLSKEKAKLQPGAERPHFGFSIISVFPWTEMDTIHGEACVIQFKQTQLQRLKNQVKWKDIVGHVDQ